ncbi:MAG: efflux RND transporter periplasmic adaptor subunit [Peptococcaceae bacterium]|nr:efflux RND transporter periplasmic adaptor subunit [Peptococcaceae bacterium]
MTEVNNEVADIKKDRKKWLKWLIVAGILLFIAILIAVRINSNKSGEEIVEETLQPVELVSVLSKPFGNEVKVAGTVTAFTESNLASKVMGRVIAIHANVGDRVRKGQALLTVDQNDYMIAVRQAESGLAMVQANTPLVTVGYDNAKLNYQRTEELFRVGAVSQSQLEATKSQLAAAQSAYDSNIAQIKQYKVMLDKARSDYNNTVITSPINGVVAKRSASVGEMISQQVPVFTVIQDDPLLVKANLTEKLVSKIVDNQQVDIFSAANGKTYKGVVRSIAPQADSITKAYPVEVKLDGVGKELKPGMVIELRIITDWLENALVVPTSVLLDQDGGGYAVFVFDKGIVKKRTVTAGMAGQGYTQIISGLKQGEKVVGRGNYLMVDGMKVTVESTRKEDASAWGGESQ